MTSSVTVLGSNNASITLSFDSNSNYALAQQIANRINASVTGGSKYLTSFDDVSPPTLPHHYVGGYYQTLTGSVNLPSGYVVDLVKTPGNALITGSGEDNQIIMSDENVNLTFVANSGSGTVVGGGGTSNFQISGNGDWELFSGAGNDGISALGKGDDTINAGGGHNTILLGSGKDVITSVGFDTIFGGTGSETVFASGASSDIVVANQSKLYFVGGSGAATIVGGSGAVTYAGAAGGSGSQFVVGGSKGNNLLTAGNGPATLFGGGNKDQLFAVGTANQSLRAAGGAETVSAAYSLGNDTLVGGTGKTTMIAGAGANTFEFLNTASLHGAAPKDTVTGLTPFSTYTIHLTGFDPNEAYNAWLNQSNSHGNTTITLSDGTKVTFENVAYLDQSKFS